MATGLAANQALVQDFQQRIYLFNESTTFFHTVKLTFSSARVTVKLIYPKSETRLLLLNNSFSLQVNFYSDFLFFLKKLSPSAVGVSHGSPCLYSCFLKASLNTAGGGLAQVALFPLLLFLYH